MKNLEDQVKRVLKELPRTYSKIALSFCPDELGGPALTVMRPSTALKYAQIPDLSPYGGNRLWDKIYTHLCVFGVSSDAPLPFWQERAAWPGFLEKDNIMDQCLRNLPDEYYQMAAENAERYPYGIRLAKNVIADLPNREESPAKTAVAMTYAFRWDAAPQGSLFWRNVRDRILYLSPLPKVTRGKTWKV